MVVLSRKSGEKIRIGKDISLTILEIHGDRVRFAVEAPNDMSVHREELLRSLAKIPQITMATNPAVPTQ